MPLRIDFSNTSPSSSTPLDSGLYPARIKQYQRKSGKEGQPQLVVQFALKKPEGRVITQTYSLQPQALGILMGHLIDGGIEVPRSEVDLDDLGLDEWEGQVELAKVPHFQDPGRMTNKVVTLRPADADQAYGWG